MKSFAYRQSGNAIFIILLGIVLFAALSYAVSQSMRVTGDPVGNEKLDIQASEILTFANSVNVSVRALITNGCADNQITFEDALTGYTNAGAPGDKSCNVFNSAGGGVTYRPPSSGTLLQSDSTKAHFGEWFFSGGHCIYGVGTGSAASCTTSQLDLIAFLPYLTKNICTSLNKKLNINPAVYSPPATDWSGYAPFTGIYAVTAQSDLGDGAESSLVGKKSGCFQASTGPSLNSYVFYAVLLAR